MPKPPPYEKSVFINCPFDDKYKPIFERIKFALIMCGFAPRSALEAYNSAIGRYVRIAEIIKQSKFSIHDLSRTQLDTKTGLPRFNMPFELGLCMGARTYGSGKQKDKDILILDSVKFRYQKSISDLNGWDPKIHGNSPKKAVASVRDWINTKDPNRQTPMPGHKDINDKYEKYRRQLPKICRTLKLDEKDLSFVDCIHTMEIWINMQP